MLRPITLTAIKLLALVAVAMALGEPAAASHLVTGNGFGFAVVSPESSALTKFYPHPYSFIRPDPANPLSEGIETPNFIKALSWGPAAVARATQYVDDAHVIRVRRADGSNGTFFMPFGFAHPALIISLEPGRRRAPSWRVEWNRPLRSQTPVEGSRAKLLLFDGIDEPLLLIPLGNAARTSSNGLLAAAPAWALIALKNESEAAPVVRDFERWRAGLGAQALIHRELGEFEQWRVTPSVHFGNDKERHLWRQSETMLRIAQSREPNGPDNHGNGLIVAALPDVYSTPWVRDMAWATVALARMGHRAEARAALLAYFNAQPTGKMRTEVNDADYQVSVVRYFGNGAEEPFFTQEGSKNIEFDDWGEVLWALGEYLRNFTDPALLRAVTSRGPIYEVARDFIVKPLLSNTEAYSNGRIVDADTSIWEERQKDKRHFAFSTAMAIVGLREFAAVADRAGDQLAQSHAIAAEVLLQKGFNAAFIRGGKLHGTLEQGVKNDIDGALLPIINFGVVDNPEVVRDALNRMQLLKVASGGYRRVRSTYTDPKIFEYWYERQEFLFVDLHFAELERRLGRDAAANSMLQRIVAKASADHNIIPEMYVAVPCKLFPGKIGDPTGAMPMVGYGAGAYVLHLLEREKIVNAHR